MLEKLYPRTMRPILDSMDVGWKAYNDAAYKEGNRAKRWKCLVLFMHKNPVRGLICHFIAWSLVCCIVAFAISLTAPRSSGWGLIAAFLLQVLYLLSLGWLVRLQPKSPMSLRERWGICSRAFLQKNKGNRLGVDRALRHAREDLEMHGATTALVLHTLIIGAIVNASINNHFIESLGRMSIRCAWGESYIGTIALLVIPFAFFARVLLYAGPMNWIRLIERHLPA
jgi:hypothetical protein